MRNPFASIRSLILLGLLILTVVIQQPLWGIIVAILILVEQLEALINKNNR